MKVSSILRYACVALTPIPVMGALTLSGPGGTLQLDDTFGVLEPLVLAPVGGDNVLFQTILFVETGGSDQPEDVYAEGRLLGQTGDSNAIALQYEMTDVLVDVTLRQSTPEDGSLPGAVVDVFFVMEVAIRNPNASAVSGYVANFFDFEMLAGFPDDDLLGLFEAPDSITLVQSNAASSVVAFVAAPQPVGFGAVEYPLLSDSLFAGPLGGLSSIAPGSEALDWTFAFERPFALDAGAKETFVFVLGALDLETLTVAEVHLAAASEGVLTLSWDGVAFADYAIFQSEDLATWDQLSSQAGVNGRNEATVTAPASGGRFFRIETR